MPGLGSMRFTGHCVVALILSGCYVTVPAPVVVSAPPSVTTPSWTATYRSYPVDEQWPCGRGSQCFFMVRLLNIETDVDQKWYSTWVGAAPGGEEHLARILGVADHVPNHPNGHFDDFGSRHAGGAHFVMGDGAVRFINESIDLGLYQGLATINAGEVIDEF